MAEKRMFSKSVIDTDAFMSMPLSAQCLYFHLAMRADDAGFVANPTIIRRVVGSTDDDFKILLAKRYILAFESGVVVIKHWWLHNVIKNDRMRHTTYKEELDTLELDEKNAYIERADIPLIEKGNQSESSRNDDNSESESSRNHLGTISELQYKGKENKGNEMNINNISPSNDGAAETEKKAIASLSKTQQSRFDAFWRSYPKKVGKQDAMKAWKKIAPDEELTNTIITAVETAKAKDSRFREERFIPHPATWLNAGSWDDEFDDYFPVQQEPKQTPAPTAQRPAQRPAQTGDDSLRKLDVDAFLEAAVAKTQRGG